MCLFLVGGDKLGMIDKNLYRMGVTEIIHLDGRKCSKGVQPTIPAKADAVVVLTDYINHNTCTAVKKQAKERKIPVIFSKRSWASLECKFKALL